MKSHTKNDFREEMWKSILRRKIVGRERERERDKGFKVSKVPSASKTSCNFQPLAR